MKIRHLVKQLSLGKYILCFRAIVETSHLTATSSGFGVEPEDKVVALFLTSGTGPATIKSLHKSWSPQHKNNRLIFTRREVNKLNFLTELQAEIYLNYTDNAKTGYGFKPVLIKDVQQLIEMSFSLDPSSISLQ